MISTAVISTKTQLNINECGNRIEPKCWNRSTIATVLFNFERNHLLFFPCPFLIARLSWFSIICRSVKTSITKDIGKLESAYFQLINYEIGLHAPNPPQASPSSQSVGQQIDRCNCGAVIRCCFFLIAPNPPPPPLHAWPVIITYLPIHDDVRHSIEINRFVIRINNYLWIFHHFANGHSIVAKSPHSPLPAAHIRQRFLR